jgi:hypothetical protein
LDCFNKYDSTEIIGNESTIYIMKIRLKSFLYHLVAASFIILVFGCSSNKIEHPEISQLRIMSKQFLQTCHEIIKEAEIYNHTLDSTSENYKRNVQNVFVVNIFEEDCIIYFEFLMTNEYEMGFFGQRFSNQKKPNYFGFVNISDKVFLITQNLKEMPSNIVEKTHQKKKFPFVYNVIYDKSKGYVTPVMDIRNRIYSYKDGEFTFISDKYW